MNYTVLDNVLNVTGLVSAFHYTFPEGFNYAGEKHNSWEFVFVDSGKLSIKADEKEYILKSGEMVCHKPLEFHKLAPYHGTASTIIICFLCGDEKMQYFNNKILSINRRQRLYLMDIVTHAEKFLKPAEPLKIAREGFMHKSQTATKESSQFIKNTTELLILSLYSSESTEIQERANSYTHYLVRKDLTENIKLYLKENIGKRITLSDISEKFSYSVSTVKTVFKEETGKSVIEYYQTLRLDAAKTLLLQKETTICDIAEVLGFNSSAHFSGFFKRATGITPTHYK